MRVLRLAGIHCDHALTNPFRHKRAIDAISIILDATTTPKSTGTLAVGTLFSRNRISPRMTTDDGLLIVTLAGLALLFLRYLRVRRTGKWISTELRRVVAQRTAEYSRRRAMEAGVLVQFPTDAGIQMRISRHRQAHTVTPIPDYIAKDLDSLRAALRADGRISRLILGPRLATPAPSDSGWIRSTVTRLERAWKRIQTAIEVL